MIKFSKDSIDETNELNEIMKSNLSSFDNIDLTVSVIEGDHAHPMQSSLVDLPQEFNRAAASAFTKSGEVIGKYFIIKNN